MEQPGTGFERRAEKALWSVRYVVLLAVFGSLVASLAVFWMATVDTVLMASHLVGYASPALERAARAELKQESVGHVIEIIDAYLLAAILLIFALGLYELFVSRLEPARQGEGAENLLLIRTLDDLKNRLGKVVMLMLVVAFFERVISVKTATPLDLLLLAGATALIGLALKLTHTSGTH
jgi:uncharacterized membrane protein YqhA